MNTKLVINIVIFAILTCTTGFGQIKNSEKILGCWKLKTIMSMDIDGDTSSLPRFTENSVTCFLKKGRFHVQISDDKSDNLYGNYNFSKDGNILYQGLDVDNKEMNEENHIILIDEKNLELRFRDLIYTFEKI